MGDFSAQEDMYCNLSDNSRRHLARSNYVNCSNYNDPRPDVLVKEMTPIFYSLQLTQSAGTI